MKLSTGLFSLACSISLAQQQPGISPDQLQKFDSMADQVKTALQAGDLDHANRVASDLMLGIFKLKQASEPTPQQKLKQLEESTRTVSRAFFLSQLARAAFDASELEKAESYARELLSVPPNLKSGDSGIAVSAGNMVLGRVVLRREKDIARAKAYLLASSAVAPGNNPTLGSFGPNMSLAKDLLEKGERDAVLDFFVRCRGFWERGQPKLDQWTAMVKGGGMPDFGANLIY